MEKKQSRSRYELVAFDSTHSDANSFIEIPLNRSGVPVYKVDLFEIDAITCPYPNVESFLKDLVNHNYLPHTMFTLKIAYKHNRELKFLDIITNDNALHVCALECISFKKQGYSSSEIQLRKSTIGGIKNEFMKFTQDNVKLKMLQSSISASILPYGLMDNVLLSKGIRSNEAYALSLEQEAELRYLENKITYILQKYKNIRGLRIWFQKYKHGDFSYFYKNRISNKKKLPNNTETFAHQSAEPYENRNFTEYLKGSDMEFLTEAEMKIMAGNVEEAVYPFVKK